MLIDILSILPLVLLVVWACALLLVDLFIPRDRKGLTALFAALGLLASSADRDHAGRDGRVGL